MPPSRLKPAEQHFIQAHLQEGVMRGESAAELQEREQWLARKFDCNARTIRSMSEQLWERARNVLGEYDFSAEEIGYVSACVEGLRQKERRAMQEQLAWELHLPFAAIQAATDGVLADKGHPAMHKNGQPAPFPEETHDHDNPKKRQYRRMWGSFLDAGIPRSQRPEKNVLCFPGRQALEIPLYLRLNFQASRIIGIEGGSRLARVQSEASSSRYGINFFAGRAEELLKGKLRNSVQIHVAHLDFESGMCETYLEILRNLYLADEAFLAVNVAGKREKSGVQQQLRSHHVNMQKSMQDVLSRKSWEEQLEALQGYFIPARRTEREKPDYVSREELCELIMATLGTARPENHLFPHGEEKVERNAYADLVSGEIAMELAKALHAGGSNPDNALKLPVFAMELTRHAMRGSAFMTNLQQYRYKSENGSPFVPQFLHVHTPRHIYNGARQSINFLIQCMEHRIRERQQPSPPESRFTLSSKRGGERMLYFVEGTLTIASVPLAAFDSDVLGAYQQLSKRHKAFRVFKGIRELL